MSGAPTPDSAPRGLALGTPCQNEHTINRAPAPDDDAFWITCGDETLSRVVVYDVALPDDQVRTWSELVMARHEIACWKQLAREARDEIDQWGHGDERFGPMPRDKGVVEMVDRINAALREGPYARG